MLPSAGHEESHPMLLIKKTKIIMKCTVYCSKIYKIISIKARLKFMSVLSACCKKRLIVLTRRSDLHIILLPKNPFFADHSRSQQHNGQFPLWLVQKIWNWLNWFGERFPLYIHLLVSIQLLHNIYPFYVAFLLIPVMKHLTWISITATDITPIASN